MEPKDTFELRLQAFVQRSEPSGGHCHFVLACIRLHGPHKAANICTGLPVLSICTVRLLGGMPSQQASLVSCKGINDGAPLSPDEQTLCYA